MITIATVPYTPTQQGCKYRPQEGEAKVTTELEKTDFEVTRGADDRRHRDLRGKHIQVLIWKVAGDEESNEVNIEIVIGYPPK